jgi:AcrR family transcriptional regulator
VTDEGPKYRRYAAEDRRAMLIEAGLACLAEGGITGFTIDRICAAADGASRGLVTHHFGSKQELLRACYTTAYDRLLGEAAPGKAAEADLGAMIEALLSDEYTTPETLKAWLALWGEVANDPDLRAEHRRYYDHYRDSVVAAVRKATGGRALAIPDTTLAVLFISVIDGLWLERCMDPDRLSREDVRRACYELLETFLGPIRPDGA